MINSSRLKNVFVFIFLGLKRMRFMYKKWSITRGYQRTGVNVFFSRIELFHFIPFRPGLRNLGEASSGGRADVSVHVLISSSSQATSDIRHELPVLASCFTGFVWYFGLFVTCVEKYSKNSTPSDNESERLDGSRIQMRVAWQLLQRRKKRARQLGGMVVEAYLKPHGGCRFYRWVKAVCS